MNIPDELFALWGRVLKNVPGSKDELIRVYLERWPNNAWLTKERTEWALHTMYLHMTRGSAKGSSKRKRVKR